MSKCCAAAKFTITVPKANPGEHFPDLNLLTKLLAPSGETNAKPPTIEVVGLYLLLSVICWEMYVMHFCDILETTVITVSNSSLAQ